MRTCFSLFTALKAGCKDARVCPELIQLPCMQDGILMSNNEKGGMELGVIGVVAPGMPPAAAREPTTVLLQRKTSNLRPAAAAAAAAVSISQDSSSAGMPEAISHFAAGPQHLETPIRRRPRAGIAADVSTVNASSDTALSHFSAESAASANLDDAYGWGGVDSPRAGPQAFQLKWPLQPQPVNSAQSHLSNAAIKIAAAAHRFSSAAGTSKSPNANMQSQAPAGMTKEGRHSSTSRRSGQSSADSSIQSSQLISSAQIDPFASRPRIGHDMLLSPASQVPSQAYLATTSHELLCRHHKQHESCCCLMRTHVFQEASCDICHVI